MDRLPQEISEPDSWMKIPGAKVVSRPGQEAWVKTHQLHPLSLAIGIFDGVHLGHQAVIESAVVTARRNHGMSALLTFTPHPSRVLGSSAPTQLLMPDGWKNQRVLALGMNAVIWKIFDREFARLQAEDFLPWLKRHLPSLATIHVGANFQFGVGRKGNIDSLIAGGRENTIDVYSVERLQYNGEAISSSRIRSDIAAGEIDRVNRMLGFPYHSFGTVQSGKKLGTELGFPTLNLPWNPECRPKYGVYAVQVKGEGRREMPAVANFGIRPTVERAKEPLLEVHMLDDCPFKEGDYVEVDWIAFLRGERKFESVGDLKESIEDDCRRARTILDRLVD